MPVLDLLSYRTAAWEKKQRQQMLTCCGSGQEGFHSWCFWTALWVGCAVGSLPQGWWVAALPGAGSLPEGTCGCLRGSGGHADGRGSAGSNLACGKCKERETGDTGYPLPSSFPAAGWEVWCQHGQKGKSQSWALQREHCFQAQMLQSKFSLSTFQHLFAKFHFTEVAGAAFP